MNEKMSSKRLSVMMLAPVLLLAGLLFISCAGIFGNRLPPLPKKTGMAAFEGPPLLVDAAYVYQKLQQGNVKLIDVRSRDDYTTGHLVGAINIPATAWRTRDAAQVYHQGNDPLRPFDHRHYEDFLGDRGISETDEVIVYGDPRMLTQSMAPVMILDWLGHRRVHFFDGDAVQIWSQGGMPLDRQNVRFRQLTEYRSEPNPELLWNKQDMLDMLAKPSGDYILWDCRSREEYEGMVQLRDVERAGHIPRAVHLDYMELYLDSPLFQVRGLSELKIRLKKAGIKPNKQVVIYCHNGSRAAYAYLVLRMMDYPDVAVYDHSWSEWGNDGDLPAVQLFDGEPTVVTNPPRKLLQKPKLGATGLRNLRW